MTTGTVDRARVTIACALALAACTAPPPPRDAVMDALDAGIDTGIDVVQEPAPPMPSRPGCNPDGGLVCNGDWQGRCTPACAPGECCSPQSGSFRCVPPDGDGYCPAADLVVDPTRIAGQWTVSWENFSPADCAIVEQCVNAPGWRRLLHFDTWTPNVGTADMFLGHPSDSNPLFVYSECHRHYHFPTYALYELVDTAGAVFSTGHKQAFCLEDVAPNPYDGGTLPVMGGVYDCYDNQGIQRGWQDVYWSALPCQWIDVTDVPAGDYLLRISLNTAHLLDETNYDNDVATVPISLPANDALADPTVPCAAPTSGADRNCGWTREGVHSCTPGAMVFAACSAACSLGTCTGDTVLRAYEGNRPTEPWDIHAVLDSNDDSLCTVGTCSEGGDCCSRVYFACPASGQYTIVWGAHESDATGVTCQVATQ